jgi:sulfite exporter TauE/SafE
MNDIVQLFLAGFAGAFGPCLFTCSPVLIPFITGTRSSLRQGITIAAAFSVARLVTFVLLGIMVALLGGSITRFLGRHGAAIAIITGALIALLGILIMLGRDLASNLCRRLHHAAAGTLRGAFVLGFMTGLLPCAAHLGVLAFIAVRGQTVWRGLTMALAFALGETWSPVLVLSVLSGWLPQALNRPRARLILTRVSGFIVLLIGLRLILFPAR